MSTAEEGPQKTNQPPAVVSILTRGTRSLLEAEGCRQWLRLYNRSGWTDRLVAAGGVIIVGLALSAIGGRRSITELKYLLS